MLWGGISLNHIAQATDELHTSSMKKLKKQTALISGRAIESISISDWPSLTGLRGLAAVWVLLLHAFNLSGKPEALPTAFAWLFQMGWVGVDIFFVLSAFLLSVPYALAIRKEVPAPDRRQYYKRRFARILPAYYLQLGLLLLLVSAGIAKSVFWYPLTMEAALAHFLFWFNSWPLIPSYVPTWWTLPVELGFYVLLPWLASCLTDRRWWYLIIGIALSLIYRHIILQAGFQRSEEIYWAENLPGRLFQFLFGMLAAFFFAKWQQKYQARSFILRNATLLVAGAALIMLPALGWLDGKTYNGSPSLHPVLAYWHVFASLLIICILWALVFGKTIFDWLLNAWPLQWLGRISYGIYLWHYPVMVVLSENMIGKTVINVDFFNYLVTSFLITITLAFLSWHWLEAPVLRRVGSSAA